MSKCKLYTAQLAGEKYDGDKKYEMVIITKWKDKTEDSPEEGHKAYYFTPDNKYLSECIKDENWCRLIYEIHPENTRFRSVMLNKETPKNTMMRDENAPDTLIDSGAEATEITD